MSKTDTNTEWLNSLKPYAHCAKDKWPGMRVSCCLAQAALETGWGKRVIGKWNLWGIKAMKWIPWFVTINTHEFIDGQRIEIPAKFAGFSTAQEAFDAYGRLVTNSDYYKKAREAPDLDSYVNELADEWATDPEYAAKIKLILDLYSLRVLDETPKGTPV